MNHLKKAFIDTILMSAILLIIAAFQKSESITRVLIPIAGVACYNFIKATYKIYGDKKNSI